MATTTQQQRVKLCLVRSIGDQVVQLQRFYLNQFSSVARVDKLIVVDRHSLITSRLFGLKST